MATKKSKEAAVEMFRAAAFEHFLALQQKENPGEFRTLDDNSILDVEVYSTGAISLDAALGVGGFQRAASSRFTVRPVAERPRLRWQLPCLPAGGLLASLTASMHCQLTGEEHGC